MAQAATLKAGALPQPAAADADRIDPRRLLRDPSLGARVRRGGKIERSPSCFTVRTADANRERRGCGSALTDNGECTAGP